MADSARVLYDIECPDHCTWVLDITGDEAKPAGYAVEYGVFASPGGCVWKVVPGHNYQLTPAEVIALMTHQVELPDIVHAHAS